MSNLQTKVALVTGGNSGIGYATAKALKADGATVIITGRRKEALDKAAAELGVYGIVADQSTVADITALAERIQTGFGKLDILFLNAGVVGMSPIESTTEAQFDDVMNINLKGTYFTLSKLIPLLADGASVVFLSSNVASMTSAGSSVYSASKTALNSVMKTAALELAPRKIRVNAVSPGPTQTAIMSKVGLDSAVVDQIMVSLEERIPLHAIGKPEDVASMVVYLSGPSAGFITGAEVLMDGGMVLV